MLVRVLLMTALYCLLKRNLTSEHIVFLFSGLTFTFRRAYLYPHYILGSGI